MNLILPDWIGAPPGIGAFSTMRSGGVSTTPLDDGTGSGQNGLNLGINVGDDVACVTQNRLRLQEFLPSQPVWLQQQHGAAVIDAAQGRASGKPCVADASFTTMPGVVCAVTTADCLPVLLTDIRGEVVGAVHAGWRGLAAGVLQNTIAAMRKAGAQQLLAWMGPAIGPQHFEVGGDVHAAMIKAHPRADAAFRNVVGKPDKYLADLYHLAHLVLADCDVARIAGGSYCTYSDAARFFSYRRDTRTGRMATVIWIK